MSLLISIVAASATRPVALLSQANDLRQVAVLSKDDFARIQYLLKKQQIEKEAQEQAAQEKEAVRLRSKELVQNWDNTLQVCDSSLARNGHKYAAVYLYACSEKVSEEAGSA